MNTIENTGLRAGAAMVDITLDKITTGNVAEESWIDSGTGTQTSIGSFSNRGVSSFSTPEGWEDAVLLFESTGVS